jgi:hypothetical protein
MNSTATTARSRYYPEVTVAPDDDDDLAPYAALFLKPFATNKCMFSRRELEKMCKDPLHSPKLIMYLIEMVKEL